MKFFLQTAFGELMEFVGSTITMKTQGLCQGNGAAPAGWAVVHRHFKCSQKQGHGARIRCPIFPGSTDLAAIIFMEDTDLLHINMTRNESLEETHKALQVSVLSWGCKLIATGGALKPSKCFLLPNGL